MESCVAQLKKTINKTQNVKPERGQAVIELIVSIFLLMAFVVGLAHLNLVHYRAIKSYQLFRNL